MHEDFSDPEDVFPEAIEQNRAARTHFVSFLNFLFNQIKFRLYVHHSEFSDA